MFDISMELSTTRVIRNDYSFFLLLTQVYKGIKGVLVECYSVVFYYTLALNYHRSKPNIPKTDSKAGRHYILFAFSRLCFVSRSYPVKIGRMGKCWIHLDSR